VSQSNGLVTGHGWPTIPLFGLAHAVRPNDPKWIQIPFWDLEAPEFEFRFPRDSAIADNDGATYNVSDFTENFPVSWIVKTWMGRKSVYDGRQIHALLF
jgi:hypothetical protein